MTNKPFIHENFLLQNKIACTLYHDFAADMPIFDYHTHLSAKEIAENTQYQNISQVWLRKDHFKWRAMRANGIKEKYISGNAPDWEKFEAFARTAPFTLCNPLYHWIHLELKKPFGISDKLLNFNTAKEIYQVCNEKLQSPEFSARGLIRQFNVKVICTNDDPVDSLEYHKKITAEPSTEVKVVPTFRAENALSAEFPKAFNDWTSRLERSAGVYISDHKSFLDALKKRHDYFHEAGCRLSYLSITRPFSKSYSEREIAQIFSKVRKGVRLQSFEITKYKSWITYELALMDSAKHWTQQIHMGQLRNISSRILKRAGRESGCDSMTDFDLANPLATHLDRLDRSDRLPKTVAYIMNPKDSMTLAATLGSFQDGSIPSKMQYGPARLFHNQKDGLEEHLTVLSNTGLLSRFIGTITDSRSFLSFSRHEYFRRILCNWLGAKVESGELPGDMALLERMVKNICYHNAEKYFRLDMPDKKPRRREKSTALPPSVSESESPKEAPPASKKTGEITAPAPSSPQPLPGQPSDMAAGSPQLEPESSGPAIPETTLNKPDSGQTTNRFEKGENIPASEKDAPQNQAAPDHNPNNISQKPESPVSKSGPETTEELV